MSHSASCLCGSVTLSIESDLSHNSMCHCRQCRKNSGHFWASANVKKSAVKITGEAHLKDYRASEKIRRRFCQNCGTWLIWEHDDEPDVSISLGCFDTPTCISVTRHIFADDKGDYYEIPQQDLSGG